MAGRSHTTRTPHRMNEALNRDAMGFVSRQNVANADFRKAIYVAPLGKGFHQVRNPVSGEVYTVADGLGGATVAPGSTVGLLSYHGLPGEVLATRAPAGFGGSATSSVTRTPNQVPATELAVNFGGYYSAWSFYCDGGEDIWLACIHSKRSYDADWNFISGYNSIRVSKLNYASVTGQIELAGTGYDAPDDGGEAGAEVFSIDGDVVTDEGSLNVAGTISIASSGGVVFVTYAEDASTGPWTVLCASDSGEVYGSDSFSGVDGRNPYTEPYRRSAIHNAYDGKFYFADPIGPGAENYRFCTRSSTNAAIENELLLNFASASRYYAGMVPLIGSGGVRIFRVGSTPGNEAFIDYNSDMTAATGWTAMSLGSEHSMGNGSMVIPYSTGYATAGATLRAPGPTTYGVFTFNTAGALVGNIGDYSGIIGPLFPCASGGVIFQGGIGSFSYYTLRRMLSNGTMA